MPAKRASVGSMRHRVVICTWIDTPDQDISVARKRPGVFEAWASVIQMKATRIADFRAAWGDENSVSHEVTIRTPSDVAIQSKHWVYHEEFGRKMWLRVVSVDHGDNRRFTCLYCRAEEIKDGRADPATQIIPKAFEIPRLAGSLL